MSGQQKQSRSWPDWIIALSSATIAVVAVYGVFFSDLADRIIKGLEDQLSETQTELVEIERQRERLTLQVETLSMQRDAFLTDTWNQLQNQLISDIEAAFLKELEKEELPRRALEELAQWRGILENWLSESGVSSSVEALKEFQQLEERHFSGKMSMARGELLTYRMNRQFSNQPFDTDWRSSVLSDVDVLMEKKRETITQLRATTAPSLAQIVRGAMDRLPMRNLLPEQRRAFIQSINSLIEGQPNVFASRPDGRFENLPEPEIVDIMHQIHDEEVKTLNVALGLLRTQLSESLDALLVNG